MSNPWAEPLPSTSSPLPIFLAVLPDLEDSKRLSVRPQHLELSAEGYKTGWILNGGPSFSGTGDERKMTGSWMLLRSTDVQAAKARLLRDIYATGGAWDLEKIVITEVGAAKQ
ncbi:hypothetical protein T439DRAFT_380083 [Meredithblackwellia eburnea MCA 4105]